MKKAGDIFVDFLRDRNLQLTKQRGEVLRIFLKTDKHLSAEELYDVVKKEKRGIGQATVFRTLKLLSEADLVKKVNFADKVTRYEVKYAHGHHDHLVCTKCGRLIEAVDPGIERLQDKLCKKFKFTPQKHRLEIFGICRRCSK